MNSRINSLFSCFSSLQSWDGQAVGFSRNTDIYTKEPLRVTKRPEASKG
jgi:hypothetical protein